MVEKEALIEEFQEVQAKYNEIVAKLISEGRKGIFDPLEVSGCDTGFHCCTGTTDLTRDLSRYERGVNK